MPDLVTLFLFLVPPDVILGEESLHVAGPAQQIAGRKSIRTRTEQAAAGIISMQFLNRQLQELYGQKYCF